MRLGTILGEAAEDLREQQRRWDRKEAKLKREREISKAHRKGKTLKYRREDDHASR